jgi:hypothetical protein
LHVDVFFFHQVIIMLRMDEMFSRNILFDLRFHLCRKNAMKRILFTSLIFAAHVLVAQIPEGCTVKEIWPDSISLIEKKGKLGLFSNEFNEAIAMPMYDHIDAFHVLQPDWAVVHLKGNLGIVSRYGQEIVDVVYEAIHPFHEIVENWALVQRKGKLGFIDLTGFEVVHPKYDEINKFGEYAPFFARVRKGVKYGFIDSDGYEIVNCRYEEVNAFGEIHPEWALVKCKGKFGMIGLEGGEMIPCEYDSFEVEEEYVYRVTKGGEEFVLDEFGNRSER